MTYRSRKVQRNVSAGTATIEIRDSGETLTLDMLEICPKYKSLSFPAKSMLMHGCIGRLNDSSCQATDDLHEKLKEHWERIKRAGW